MAQGIAPGRIMAEVDGEPAIGVPVDAGQSGQAGRLQQAGADAGRKAVATDRDQRHPGPEGIAAGGMCAIGAGIEMQVGKRSEEHTSELQSLMRRSYAVFCLKKK